ncbi:MAG TPA: MarR family winged helix-turn-helix transcriptional regulator [Oculatellaceae cyanobacterium]
MVSNQCTAMHVRRTSRAVTQYYDKYLTAAGITAAQFTLLVAITLAAQSTVTKLAEILGTDRTTLSRSLKPLEDLGIVQIAAGEDKRTKVIALSSKGKAVLAKALPLWTQAQESFVYKMGQGNWQDFIQKLNAASVISQE